MAAGLTAHAAVRARIRRCAVEAIALDHLGQPLGNCHYPTAGPWNRYSDLCPNTRLATEPVPMAANKATKTPEGIVVSLESTLWKVASPP